MEKRRWQDGIMFLFGAWLFFSPYALNYSDMTSAAAWMAFALGIALVVLAVAALADPTQIWEERVHLVIGVWLIVSPFVLRYNMEAAPIWNQGIVGLLILVISLWALIQHPVHRTA